MFSQKTAIDLRHPLRPRVERLTGRLLEPQALLPLERVEPVLPADFPDRVPIVRRGMMFRGVLRAIATPIREDELLVGDVPYDGFAANREIMPGHLEEDEAERLRAGAIEKFFQLTGTSKVRDYPGTVFGMARNFGHIIADYQLPLRIGFGGIHRRITKRLSELPDREEDATPERHFLEAALLSVRGAEHYIRRYGNEARRLLEEARWSDRRSELQHLAEMCDHIATEPPEVSMRRSSLFGSHSYCWR